VTDPYRDPATINGPAPAQDEPPDTPVEAEATGRGVPVPLCGKDIHVPPTVEWRSSALKALHTGDYETWAERTLSEQDYNTWMDVDPTLGEVQRFFADAAPAMGLSLGNSKASRRALRATRTP
jgi:hypothetical protein